MKNHFLRCFLLLFFICCQALLFGSGALRVSFGAKAASLAGSMAFEFVFEGKKFVFFSDEILNYQSLSPMQKEIVASPESRLEAYNKVSAFLADKFDALLYCYPELENIFNKLSAVVEVKYVPEKVLVVPNSCKLWFESAKDGRFLDKEDFTHKFLSEASKKENRICFEITAKNYKKEENLREKMVEKGCFSTNFSSSNDARKNNIRAALQSFDGIMLDDGEILSFNETTGKRTEESGYQKAKIISGGTFTEGYGGGVCQVSTTLYNACLLSGLEILEVHNHSLPVSYVEPSFDAMVNSGSSDLVVRNNSGGKILITTSYNNDICKIKIFGPKNKYKITRFSEKTKILPAEKDSYDADYQKYGLELEFEGDCKRISYPKDGYLSNGYLNFYDSQGNLVETRKIRSNRYNPQKGIIAIREN